MRASGYRIGYVRAGASRGIEGISFIFCSVYDQEKPFNQKLDEVVVADPRLLKVKKSLD